MLENKIGGQACKSGEMARTDGTEKSGGNWIAQSCMMIDCEVVLGLVSVQDAIGLMSWLWQKR